MFLKVGQNFFKNWYRSIMGYNPISLPEDKKLNKNISKRLFQI